MKKQVIAVWFSCGAASAVAAKLAVDQYGADNTVRIINNPIAEEDEDNGRFLRDVEEWVGVEIEFATNPKFPSNSCMDVWGKRQYMSGTAGAPCTVELKKEARRLLEDRNHADWIVLGFTANEKARHERFVLGERGNVMPVLIDANLTKDDCFKIIVRAGIELPRIYYQGYPNANCIGCVKATSPTYWNHVRNCHPEVFIKRAEQSREIGARLVRVKGERVFLDELDPNATGNPMASMNIECGIFCEEQQELF